MIKHNFIDALGTKDVGTDVGKPARSQFGIIKNPLKELNSTPSEAYDKCIKKA